MYDNDLLSSVIIRAVSQLQSSSKITHISDMEIKYFISMLESYFDTISSSNISLANSLSSYVNITKKPNLLLKDFNSKVTILRYLDILSNANIVPRYNSELFSEAKITNFNNLDVNYEIYKYEHYNDFQSNSEFHIYNDTLSEGKVRQKSYFDTPSQAEIFNHSNLSSRFYKPYNEDLLSELKVTENNFMNFIYNLVQAPIITTNCPVVADAYVRQYRPTLNYGSTLNLSTGSLSEGLYRSVIRLDITNYKNTIKNDINLISTLLKLKVSGNYSGQVIDVYECDVSWNESSITWSNFNPSLSRKLFSFTCDSDTISINIKNYLDELISKNKTYADLVFKLQNEQQNTVIFFYSRESEIQNRPTIEIKYQNNTWNGFVELTDLLSQIYVKAKNNKDIISYAVFRQTDVKDIISSITIKQFSDEDLFSKSKLQQKGFKDLDSLADFYIAYDLICSTIIKQHKNYDLNSHIDVVASNSIDSEVEVSGIYCSSLRSDVKIRRPDKNDLDSNTNIYNYEDIISNLLIKQTYYEDLLSNSILKVKSNKDLTANTYIIPNSNLDSNVTIQQSFNEDLLSLALFRLALTEDINSSAVIWHVIELLSEAIIQKYFKYDLSSTAKLRRSSYNEISSTAFIHLINELISEVMIRIKGYDELLSRVIIKGYSNIDINSGASVRPGINIISNATIRLSKFKDINSNSLFKQCSNLDCSVNVNARLKDILCSVNIYNTSNIDSDADIFRTKDLNSYLKIRRTENKDLLSKSTIQLFDIEEIDSKATIYSSVFYYDIESISYFRRFTTFDFISTAIIRTTARQWIPNLHGRKEFNYETRKLPRKWIRENFIP